MSYFDETTDFNEKSAEIGDLLFLEFFFAIMAVGYTAGQNGGTEWRDDGIQKKY